MRRRARIIATFSLVIILGVLLAKRAALETTSSPASRLLPNLPDYRQVDGTTLTAYIGALAEGAALLGAQPQLATGIGVIDQAVGCYQDAGAIQARLYSHRQQPLAAGAVAIADLDKVLDAEVLLACVGPGLLGQESSQIISGPACLEAYALSNTDGSFKVLFAGSTESVCLDLCSQLSGCEIANLGIAPFE